MHVGQRQCGLRQRMVLSDMERAVRPAEAGHSASVVLTAVV
jgi:hypothetical protein